MVAFIIISYVICAVIFLTSCDSNLNKFQANIGFHQNTALLRDKEVSSVKLPVFTSSTESP